MVHSVTLKRLNKNSVSKQSLYFSSMGKASIYLGRAKSFLTNVYNHKCQYIAKATDGSHWLIYKIDDKLTNYQYELNRYYHPDKPEKVEVPKLTRSEKLERRERALVLLTKIETKYGSLAKAKNTKELLELRKLENGVVND